MLTIRPVAEYGRSGSIMLRFINGTVGRVGLAPHVERTGAIRCASKLLPSKIQRSDNKSVFFYYLMTLLVAAVMSHHTVKY